MLLRSGKYYRSYSFTSWKYDVNKLVKKNVGLECDDLPDEDYYYFWEKNYSPKDMCNIVICHNKIF